MSLERRGHFISVLPLSLPPSLGVFGVYLPVSLQVQTPGCLLLVNWVCELSPLLMSRSDLSGIYLPEAQSRAGEQLEATRSGFTLEKIKAILE